MVRRLVHVLIVSPVARTSYGSGRLMEMETQSPSTIRRVPSRGNDVRVGLDTLNRLRVSVYIRPETISRLLALTRTASSRGLRFVLNRLACIWSIWLINLLTRLRIPRIWLDLVRVCLLNSPSDFSLEQVLLSFRE